MIGPDCTGRGGIASVIIAFRDSGIFDKWPIIFLPTYVDGKKSVKLRLACTSLLRFICLILSGKVSVLHVHTAAENSFWRKSIFMFIALLSRKPVILHIHSGKFPTFYWEKCSLLGKFIIRFFLNRSDHLIVLSTQWISLIKSITKNSKVCVIPNFVEIPEMKFDEAQQREECTILFLGRLNNDKGLFDLVNALTLIKHDYPSLRLEICGDGDASKLIDLISKLNLKENINFNGWISGDLKVKLLQKATIYVLPSYFEGLPMGVLEAMSYGLPVIASDVGGIPDIVKSGNNGLLIKPGDIQGLSQAINSMLKYPNKREMFSKKAREVVAEFFSSKAVLPKIDELYKSYGLMPRYQTTTKIKRAMI